MSFICVLLLSYCNSCIFVDVMQNAQAMIDLNLASQERDKSLATKDARSVSLQVNLRYPWLPQGFQKHL